LGQMQLQRRMGCCKVSRSIHIGLTDGTQGYGRAVFVWGSSWNPGERQQHISGNMAWLPLSNSVDSLLFSYSDL